MHPSHDKGKGGWHGRHHGFSMWEGGIGDTQGGIVLGYFKQAMTFGNEFPRGVVEAEMSCF